MAERAGRGKRFPCGARRAGPGAGRGAREISWFRTIPFGEPAGRLRKLCDRVTGPGHNVDNIMLTHSLRPHTMEGHMAPYGNVLHHTGNSLPDWVLELIGVRVSALNGCDWRVEHHAAGPRSLAADDVKADALPEPVRTGVFDWLRRAGPEPWEFRGPPGLGAQPAISSVPSVAASLPWPPRRSAPGPVR